jgi:hypothetical protein
VTVRRTKRGALVVMARPIPSTRTIVFQYNPTTVRRRLEPQTTGADRASRSSPLMYTGAPIETLELEVEIDAGDQQAFANGPQSTLSIQPQLAAIELLLYPSSSQVSSSEALLAAGTLEIGRYLAPTVLFVWGSQRVIPVRVTSYAITEEAFDGELNPIRARVTLALQAVSYSDTLSSDPSYSLFMAYQSLKESQAADGYAQAGTDLTSLIGINPSSEG